MTPDWGAGFERHAATRIRGALLDELRDSDWASRSDFRGRLDAAPRPLLERAAEAGARAPAPA